MLSNLQMNMLQALGFGAQVQMNGKQYVGIIRLNERAFLAIPAGSQLPATLELIQADISVVDPNQQPPGQPGGPPAPDGNDPAPTGDDGGNPTVQETLGDIIPKTPGGETVQ